VTTTSNGLLRRYSFIYQDTSTKETATCLFGLRVKLPPVITSLTTHW